MSIDEDIFSDVIKIRDADWNKRKGIQVPGPADITLSNGAVEIEATYLYTDLANSSAMAKTLDRRVTAKILKSYLAVSSRLIRHFGGKVMSFDGDRVMGAFMGESKNTSAIRCSFGIAYAVTNLICPKFEEKYNTLRNSSFSIKHATGIDQGTVFLVRGGVHGSNELISIGRAPNLAAKLSDIRETNFSTFATASVYNKAHHSTKVRLDGSSGIWEAQNWNYCGEMISIYRSSYWRKPAAN
ncbi:MAG: adenylate/guanylate cyclase domain-containing protein [Pseudomonadota bacterium]